MNFSRSKNKKAFGFTLIEVTIASIIFGMSMIVISYATISFYQGKKRQIARNALMEETKALMERMVQEVRTKTIDYDEYFNQLPTTTLGGPEPSTATAGGDYGQFYRQYYHHFWYIDPAQDDTTCGEYGVNDPSRYEFDPLDPCYDQHVNEGYFSTRADNNTSTDDATLSALDDDPAPGVDTEKAELYLISSDGKQKTILKRIANGIDDDYDGTIDESDAEDTGVEQIGIIMLDLKDQYDNTTIKDNNVVFTTGEDGYYDCWAPNNDFEWTTNEVIPIPISPPNMEILELKFFITPIEDPRKAFNEADIEVQMHPSITILLTTQISSRSSRQFRGALPQPITLQTTVSSRVYESVGIPFEFSGTNPIQACLIPASAGGGVGGCPNDILEGTEQCDTSQFGGATCTSLGFLWGTLACNGGCTFDTNGCSNVSPADCNAAGAPTCDGQTATICIVDLGGTPIIIGGSHDGEVYAGLITEENGSDVIVGTDTDDKLYGGNGADVICGLGGIDHIYGGNAQNTIYGGEGNDFLFGGNGKDELYGEGGDDLVNGEIGKDDVIDGGSGTGDTCEDEGANTINCETLL